jgi:predicted RNase H-like HicB family nuclease
LFEVDECYRKDMKLKVIVWQEEDVWCGSVPALPGCHTWGETYEELIVMLKDAITGWLEVASQGSETESNKQIVEIYL